MVVAPFVVVASHPLFHILLKITLRLSLSPSLEQENLNEEEVYTNQP